MREIKFSCMWSDGKSWIDFRHTLEEMENGEHWEAMSDMSLLKKFKLKHKRQYTGLKDRNGVEIYEGDIVSGKWIYEDNKEDLICAVEYQSPYFYPFGAYRGDGSGLIYHTGITESNFIVIGNIYGNPELIEACL